MTSLAPTLQKFFTDRLTTQRAASPHTLAAYRDTFRLLLEHVHRTTTITPARLDLSDLDATVIAAFLTHLELDRHNSVRTRNTRLAAIRSFYSYAALECPADSGRLVTRLRVIDTARIFRVGCDTRDPNVSFVYCRRSRYN